jgi:hypothetical protein
VGRGEPRLRVVRAALLALAVLTVASCSTPEPQRVRPGCGIVAAGELTGLMRAPAGEGLTARRTGALDDGHLRCVTRGSGVVRRVSVDVLRHPAPLSLDDRACRSGWMYAGTPQSFSPTCQDARGAGGVTTLLARRGDHVITVVVTRTDRAWAGDPEAALDLADSATARLDLG